MNADQSQLAGSDNAPLLYLDLLKNVLTRVAVRERYVPLRSGRYGPTKRLYRLILPRLQALLAKKNLEIVRRYEADWSRREQGWDWPPEAETMAGLKRLNNLQACLTDVILNRVPGDVIETGVWRGGCSIFMKGVLQAYGDTGRVVWLADSFEGLPKPNPEMYPADAGDSHWTRSDVLAIPLETVVENFKRYGLLDDRVRFLKGWFKDTLKTAPIERIAIARLDGDMYESTIQALESLYDKVSAGGYVIIDDYGLPGCRAAVDEFRAARKIADPITQVDWSGVYWRRSDLAPSRATQPASSGS